MNITRHYTSNTYSVDGVPGWFSVTRSGSNFWVRHVGHGRCELVGCIPAGIYGDRRQGIRPQGNPEAPAQIEAAIQRYVEPLSA